MLLFGVLGCLGAGVDPPQESIWLPIVVLWLQCVVLMAGFERVSAMHDLSGEGCGKGLEDPCRGLSQAILEIHDSWHSASVPGLCPVHAVRSPAARRVADVLRRSTEAGVQ